MSLTFHLKYLFLKEKLKIKHFLQLAQTKALASGILDEDPSWPSQLAVHAIMVGSACILP